MYLESCSQCGPEPRNPKDAHWWRRTYYKHHGFYPGYGISKTRGSILSSAQQVQAPEPKTQQDDNPGLWDK